MVRDNITDKEQIELIKKWWNSHGKMIAVAVVLGLLVGFGWRYWHQHQEKKATQASVLYQQLRVAVSQKDSKLANTISEKLMHDYRHTPYASFVGFSKAQQAVLANQFDKAFTALEWVRDNARINSFKQIARVRAARVLLAEKKPESALDLLKKVDDKTYQPLVDQVNGDAYFAVGNKKAAELAYQKAQEGFAAANIDNPLLDMQAVQLKGVS